MRMRNLIIAAMMFAGVLAQACPAPAKTVILVSAAASLSDAFREVGTAFESDNPDIAVEFNFASSGALLRQIELGAPVDVFASADMRTMELAVDEGLVMKDTVSAFASNSLVLITPADPRAGLKGPYGLLSTRVARVAVGNPKTVPAGLYAKESLAALGVWDGLGAKLVLAENVRQVLDYVRRGEVDAGVVYATDADTAKGGVRIAARLDTITPVLYPAAVARGCADREAAKRFVGYLKGEKAAALLERRGFGKPGK